jgi:DNA-binding transcriptional LysR family regulator
VFAVAPGHPLASLPSPLPEAAIEPHRIVVAADSSRKLVPRSVGALAGQDTLTVPDLEAKVAAQLAGLGCGWLPAHLAASHVAAGRLVIRPTEVPRAPAKVQAAWRQTRPGKALAWWIDAIAAYDWRSLASGAIAVAAAQPAGPLERQQRQRRKSR